MGIARKVGKSEREIWRILTVRCFYGCCAGSHGWCTTLKIVEVCMCCFMRQPTRQDKISGSTVTENNVSTRIRASIEAWVCGVDLVHPIDRTDRSSDGWRHEKECLADSDHVICGREILAAGSAQKARDE